MFTLFKIILIFALVIAILLGATLFRIYRNIRDTLHSFGFTTREETIYTHNAKQMKKKIIPKDEGEYVDFTEVQ